MKNINILLQKLKNKSNIDYVYYHLFNNKVLDLVYDTQNFTINYIIYIINSDFSYFYKKYKEINREAITDIFLERINLLKEDKTNLFNIKFKNLFWLKLNNILFFKEDYGGLIKFLQLNHLDINRIFLENLKLENDFFLLWKNLKGFENLSFINFDNNNLSNIGLDGVLFFLKKNKINLEYLSLINNNFTNSGDLLDYINFSCSNIRILDLSSNNLFDKENIISFINQNKKIKELFLRNIEFSNKQLEKIYKIFFSKNTNIYILRLSLRQDQKKYKIKFQNLAEKLNIYFDIDISGKSNEKIYSTIYIKGNKSKELEEIENDYFYVLDRNKLDLEFKNLIKNKNRYLNNGINLFLFDFNDYEKIDYLLENYNFNYIYVENYFISNENFIIFIDSIKKQKQKKYKINFISIEISEFQLNFLINNFPKNIFYLEVNLNKIEKNRELYISKMLKNKAFIFENMEFYQKIFK